MPDKANTSSTAASLTPASETAEEFDDESEEESKIRVRFNVRGLLRVFTADFYCCGLQQQIRASSLGSKHAGEGDDNDNWTRTSRQLLRPADQMDLTETELSEEIPKILSTENRHLPQNLVIYSFKEGAYIPIPKSTNVVTIFECEGSAIHIESAEAKAQIARDGVDPRIAELKSGTQTGATTPDLIDRPEGTPEQGEGEGSEAGGEVEVEGEEEHKEVAVGTTGGPKKKLTNQFNFCERAALTCSNPSRSVETQTVPPPRSQFGANVVQWHIYDSYNEDFDRQTREKEKEMMKEKKPGLQKHAELKRGDAKNKATEEFNRKYLQKCQILERMVNQNIFDDIAHGWLKSFLTISTLTILIKDFRYYEDPSDEFREDDGTLLPLWKFTYDKCKKMSVTDICLNTHYFDLYAVCFGSFEFIKQVSEGCVCLFSIKNPSFPEYRITTESGAMCCDVHKKYPYLIVIGQYDGNVCVYNLQMGTKEPVYVSQGVNGKHSEAVWEIKWGEDMQDGEINFYSLSSDGRVFNWVLMQNKLTLTTIITLYLDVPPVCGPDGTMIKLKASGTCMMFHPTNKEIFQVGTEDGLIFKCSTAYSSKYLMVYQAHYLSVYRMDYNKFNSNIFVSCSGDWRVKIWEDMRNDPLFIFDLGASVGDVKWAPYSSTVFAAVTSEGRVFVFDLNVNKYKAICSQQVVPRKKNKLTRITFNNKLPFLIVGDDKGTSITLKLSPNLRLLCKPPKKQGWMDQHTLQVQKLDRLLSLVRELPEGGQSTENDPVDDATSN
ncbi:CLUMA_CG009995, isoform A [Clunio marinus]|uniref:CLUMA_CG009995, isoform A n=1 Tax=Clunio marinus TaxID=568069 RepID=A0A1J1I815_9DIPT|nr:CLUMA_CG009995, isoform A [Clunio marinus]